MICECPAAAALPDIPASKCPENFGQIQKVAFQRLRKDDGTRNSFTTAKPIATLASWTPLLTAADSTKIIVSPTIQAPTTEPGDPITFGGGNDTPGGAEIIVGTNATTFTGAIRQVSQATIKAMKQLMCESQAENLGVYLFDHNGAIGALSGDTAGTYYPIPIRSLFVGDKTFGGLQEPDSNAVQWSFMPNWSDNFAVVDPEFDPLSDLIVTTTSEP